MLKRTVIVCAMAAASWSQVIPESTKLGQLRTAANTALAGKAGVGACPAHQFAIQTTTTQNDNREVLLAVRVMAARRR